MVDDSTLSLVQSAQGGDRQALEQLFSRYLPRVRQIVAFRLGYRLEDFATYEDLVQEGLAQAFRNLERFEQRSEGSFRNWIASCVANTVSSHFRKAHAAKRGGGKVRPFSSYESEDVSVIVFEGKDPSPSTLYSRKEMLAKVEDAMLRMKEHQREAIVLRLFCEMSYDEVAETMGFSEEATARKVVSRALESLRKLAGL